MNAKIRNAQLMKVPYMLVVGDQEVGQPARSRCAAATAARQNDLPVAEFVAMVTGAHRHACGRAVRQPAPLTAFSA